MTLNLMARLLESTMIEGPAGLLEALHEGPENGVPISRAAVLCHPHPLYGGTMHNKVVFRLARAARRAGSAVLRFNFRGVGLSGGQYADGVGEQNDLEAAIEHMKTRYPQLPLTLAGFSFGARVALQVFCGNAGFERVICCGMPVSRGDWGLVEPCAGPKFFVQSTNDEYGPRGLLEAMVERAGGRKQLTWVDSTDHFFSDALDSLEEAAHAAMIAPIE